MILTFDLVFDKFVFDLWLVNFRVIHLTAQLFYIKTSFKYCSEERALLLRNMEVWFGTKYSSHPKYFIPFLSLHGEFFRHILNRTTPFLLLRWQSDFRCRRFDCLAKVLRKQDKPTMFLQTIARVTVNELFMIHVFSFLLQRKIAKGVLLKSTILKWCIFNLLYSCRKISAFPYIFPYLSRNNLHFVRGPRFAICVFLKFKVKAPKYILRKLN